MTDARQRLVFIDTATGNEFKWHIGTRGMVLSVVYLGKRVGKLTDYGAESPYWYFDELIFLGILFSLDKLYLL